MDARARHRRSHSEAHSSHPPPRRCPSIRTKFLPCRPGLPQDRLSTRHATPAPPFPPGITHPSVCPFHQGSSIIHNADPSAEVEKAFSETTARGGTCHCAFTSSATTGCSGGPCIHQHLSHPAAHLGGNGHVQHFCRVGPGRSTVGATCTVHPSIFIATYTYGSCRGRVEIKIFDIVYTPA